MGKRRRTIPSFRKEEPSPHLRGRMRGGFLIYNEFGWSCSFRLPLQSIIP